MRTLGRLLLAAFMGIAGMGHFLAVDAFRAQVPDWVPFETAVILVSGVIELAIAAALIAAPASVRARVGWFLAAFLVAVFPGNVSQYLSAESAFGMDSDGARLGRLFFQPVLIAWALWSTGAWPRAKPRTP